MESMSARAILLRLLLCFALVLNGVAPAMASVRMHAGTDDRHAAASEPAQVAGHAMPCHEDGSPPMASPEQSPKQPAAPGCCKSATCACACISHAAAMPPAMAFHGAAMPHAGDIRPMPAGHAAPALPHLIRPPIG